MPLCPSACRPWSGLVLGLGVGVATHDMPRLDMAPRPRAVTPPEKSPSPRQFVHLTLQLAHDRCLFSCTSFLASQWCLWAQGTHGIWYGYLSMMLLPVYVWNYTSDTFHMYSNCICSLLSIVLVCFNRIWVFTSMCLRRTE